MSDHDDDHDGQFSEVLLVFDSLVCGDQSVELMIRSQLK
jgi:hypothetical protein